MRKTRSKTSKQKGRIKATHQLNQSHNTKSIKRTMGNLFSFRNDRARSEMADFARGTSPGVLPPGFVPSDPPPRAQHTVEARDVRRFDVDDPEMVAYLEEYGYVVIKDVASPSAVEQAHKLLWEFLSSSCGMIKEQPHTWTDSNFSRIGSVQTGIMHSNGINQSDFLWHARLLPDVQRAFALIFKDDKLLTSFDGGNVFRPWHNFDIPDSSYIKTKSGWYHVDQGRLLRGLQCVQGLVSFTDADAETGGFCVLPKSHNFHDELMTLQEANGDRNFVRVPPDFPALAECEQIMPKLKAGDMLLWDSRTIHCNCPSLQAQASPTQQQQQQQVKAVVEDGGAIGHNHSIETEIASSSSAAAYVAPTLSKPHTDLLRAVAYVCMTPAKWASPEVIRTRVKLFERGQGTTHWPHILSFSLDEEDAETEKNWKCKNKTASLAASPSSSGSVQSSLTQTLDDTTALKWQLVTGGHR